MHFYPTLDSNYVTFTWTSLYNKNAHFKLTLKISSPYLILAHYAGISIDLKFLD